jgi:alpha-1,6-mannosyltransferase
MCGCARRRTILEQPRHRIAELDLHPAQWPGAANPPFLKICDLTQFYSPVSGGVKRYVQEKVAFIRRTQCDEHVLIVPGETDSVIEGERSRTYTVRSPLVARTSRYRMLLRLHAVEAILERERPDIIESGDPYQIAWKAQASGRALGIPTVGFYHSHFPEAYLRSATRFLGRGGAEVVMDISRHYVRKLYSRFAQTFVPSPALAAVLRGWGVENVVNIDLGVDTAIFNPEPLPGENVRAELGVPDSRILLLYVGRLASEKNTRTLFEAFRIIARLEPGRFHLVAIGDGTQRTSIEALRDELQAVSWFPYVSESKRLAQFYRAADLFVHPGVQETFGLASLESQACGTPVLGIRGSYMDRIIFSDQTCWAPENSPEALAQAIRDAASTDLRDAGLAASRRVLAGYSWSHVFERLFSVYRRVVSSFRPD